MYKKARGRQWITSARDHPLGARKLLAFFNYVEKRRHTRPFFRAPFYWFKNRADKKNEKIIYEAASLYIPMVDVAVPLVVKGCDLETQCVKFFWLEA